MPGDIDNGVRRCSTRLSPRDLDDRKHTRAAPPPSDAKSCYGLVCCCENRLVRLHPTQNTEDILGTVCVRTDNATKNGDIGRSTCAVNSAPVLLIANKTLPNLQALHTQQQVAARAAACACGPPGSTSAVHEHLKQVVQQLTSEFNRSINSIAAGLSGTAYEHLRQAELQGICTSDTIRVVLSNILPGASGHFSIQTSYLYQDVAVGYTRPKGITRDM